MSSTSTFVEKVVAGWEVVTKFRSEYKYIIDLIAAIFKTFLALIILGFFAANFALSLQTRDEINSLTDSQELAFATIEITHELAKERGMSNVFVLSAGVEFSSRIGSQRSEVDRVVSDSLGVLDRFSSSGSDKVQRLVNNILSDLAQLPTIRSRIDTLNITSAQVISFYSDLNSNLVKVAEELPPPDAGDVTKAINTYVNFAYFKDRVGLERAGIAAVTYQGFYNKGQRDDIVGSLAQQDALTLLYNVSAKDSHEQWLAGLKAEPRWLNFTTKAKEVLANTGVNVTGLTFDVYGWWDSITPAIDNLRITLELALQDDLTDETDAALANIRDLIIINSFGMGLTIIIICAYIIIIIFNASFALGKYLRIKKKVMDMTKEIQEDSNWD